MGDEQREDHAGTVRDSISRNVAVDMAARVGYLASRFLLPPFILAHITLEAYGLWATAFIVVSYVGISTMGISGVYIKYVAEFSARREYERANKLLSTGLFLTVPLCAALFGLVYLLWPHLVGWLHVAPKLQGDAREVVLIVTAIFLTSISLCVFADALIAVQQTAAVQMIWVFTYSLETVLIFVFLGTGRGIRGLAEAFLIRTALEILACATLAYRMLPWLRLSASLISRDSYKLLFAFGGVVQLQSFLNVALNSVERAIAAPLVGLAATGLLDLGKKLPAMAGSIPLAFTWSLIPAASYLQGGIENSQEQRETLRKLYLKAGRYMHLSSGMLFAILAALPFPILSVWIGKSYQGVAYIMTVFCLASQMNLLTGPGSSMLRGIGKPKEEFYYSLPNVLMLAITLPISRLILGAWTATGIGTAVAVATCVSAAYFIGRANRILEIPFATYWKTVALPGMVPYAVSLPLAFPALLIVEHSTRWAGAGWIAAFGLIYGVLSLLCIIRFVLEPGERLWFQAILAAKFGRVMPALKAA